MRRYQEPARVIVLFAAISLHSAPQTPKPESVTGSHIDANVPAPDEFHALIVRDLKTFLDRRTKQDLKIDYELLREGPTQTGISYPKYYVWVRGLDRKRLVVEGAARVAAIDRMRFEVTDFLSRQEIRTSPEKVEKIFPAALRSLIAKKASAE